MAEYTIYIQWNNGFLIKADTADNRLEAIRRYEFLVQSLPNTGECWVELWNMGSRIEKSA